MFDNTNPYTLRTEVAGGITRYFVSFADCRAVLRETEVSRPVYLEFLRFVRLERNLRRFDERHTEQSVLTDETLNRRALYPPKDLEETVFAGERSEQLRRAIQSLPEIQRRRFVLHHEFGLTYGQIARLEDCSLQVVAKAVKAAEKNIKKYFEKQG
jgi:RNA polymerase sigma-70 factor (ECF subfamily)